MYRSVSLSQTRGGRKALPGHRLTEPGSGAQLERSGPYRWAYMPAATVLILRTVGEGAVPMARGARLYRLMAYSIVGIHASGL